MMILALDIATQCGVAYGDSADKAPTTFTVNLGSGKSNDVAATKLYRLIRARVDALAPDFVGIEAYQPFKGTSANVVSRLGGFHAVAGLALTLTQTKHERFMPASIRKGFLGRNVTSRDFQHLAKQKRKGAVKQAVIDRCNELGWRVEDDNAADAAAVWAYSCMIHDPDFTLRAAGGLL